METMTQVRVHFNDPWTVPPLLQLGPTPLSLKFGALLSPQRDGDRMHMCVGGGGGWGGGGGRGAGFEVYED